jgi:hypothetical protein
LSHCNLTGVDTLSSRWIRSSRQTFTSIPSVPPLNGSSRPICREWKRQVRKDGSRSMTARGSDSPAR